MKKLIDLLHYNMFNKTLSIKNRLLNLIMSSAAIAASAALIVELILSQNLYLISVLALAIITFSVCIYLSAFKNKQRLSSFTVVIITDEILFPAMYFLSGGIHSAISVWFVLGLIFSFLVLEKMSSLIMFVVNLFTFFCCLIAEFLYPELISNSTTFSPFFDMAIAVSIVAIIINYIFRYQSNYYEDQNEYISSQENSLEQTMAQLRQAMEKLDNANMSKSIFLTNLSYEIRTPVNAILGMSELALMENTNANVATQLHNIRHACDNLIISIEDILDYTNIENGEFKLNPFRYEAGEMLTNIYTVASHSFANENVQLNYNCDENIPSILLGDFKRISQSILNIINFTLHNSKIDSMSINVKFEKVSSEKGIIEFKLKDAGKGINTDKGEIPMKLTLSKRIIDSMNGTVDISSKLGIGTTYVIRIPQQIISDTPLGKLSSFVYEKNDALNNDNAADNFYASEAKILIVDDVKMNLEVFKGLLESTKINIDCADNGKSAIEMAENNEYDLVLMDILMPEMDGIQTLNKMSMSDKISDKLKVIALSANAIKGIDESLMTAGFCDFISKPVKKADLIEIIFKYLPQNKISMTENNSIINKATSIKTFDLSKDHAEQIENSISAQIDNSKINYTDPISQISESDVISDIENASRELAIFNPADALEYCAGNESLLKAAIKAFLDGNEKSGLINTYKSGDWPEYRIKAHAIKGAARTLGATRLFSIATEVEAAAKCRDFIKVKSLHDYFLDVYQETLEHLDSYIQ